MILLTERSLFGDSSLPLKVRDQIAVAPSGPVTVQAVKLVFGISGWAHIDAAGAELLLQAGTILGIPPGVECSGIPHGHARTVTLYLQPDYGASELRWLSPAHPMVQLLNRSLQGAPRVEHLQLPLNAMRHLIPHLTHIAQPDTEGDEFALLSGVAQVARMVGRFSGLGSMPPGHSGPAPALPSREVAIATMLLHQNPERAWTVETLAARVMLSSSQLTWAFRAQVAISPAAYLRQVRTDRMAELFITDRLSVAGAARLVGWGNPGVASRAFKRRYGVTPRAFATSVGHART